jgi:hypothetical protein
MAEEKATNPFPDCAGCEKHAELDGCPHSVIGNCPPARFRQPKKNGGKKPPVKLN